MKSAGELERTGIRLLSERRCRKVYTTENAYKAHLVSKKHREKEAAAATNKSLPLVSVVDVQTSQSTESDILVQQDEPMAEASTPHEGSPDVPMSIEAKIAASRSKIPPTSCIFCPIASDSIELNVEHMRRAHGLFIPDQEYLVDLPGLLTHLGEKVAVDNICLWCNGRGKTLHSLDAVRKHMQDKSHCKIAYDTENDRLDISDYYDFTSSYATPARPKLKPSASSSKSRKQATEDEEEEEWEDDENMDEGDADEVVEENESEEEDLEDLQVSYGDTQYELVLPTGARIGHRSLRRYYAQRFSNPLPSLTASPNSETAIVRRLIKDRKTAQIPASGADFGGAGRGMMTIKVQSIHQAKEAGRHIREHRDSRRKEEFRTKVGFIHNNQKHFRDQLLQ